MVISKVKPTVKMSLEARLRRSFMTRFNIMMTISALSHYQQLIFCLNFK